MGPKLFICKNTFDFSEFGDYIAHKSATLSKKEIPFSVSAQILFSSEQILFSSEQIDLQQGYKECHRRRRSPEQIKIKNENTFEFLLFRKWFSMSSAAEELFLLECLECGVVDKTTTQNIAFEIILGIFCLRRI